MKPLMRVTATEVPALIDALRVALDGGPAVWPMPREVARSADGSHEVPDDIALVVETSGSTGAPKRVMLTADALIASADATADRLDGPGRWLLALPGHYIAGTQVLVRSMLAGTTPVLLGDGPFTPEAFAAASARLDADAPRYTSLVPVQLARVVERAQRDAFVAAALTGYDAVLVGGQALPPELAARAEELGARIVRTYGSSETAGGCVYDGRALDGVDVRIVDGTVELSGPMLAEGYLGDPERTEASFTTDARGRRWYRTGDLGELTAEGALRIRGRADDVIISGGVKVALGEVERAVRSRPGLAEAVVVAVADPAWGERPAVVAPATDAATSATLGDLASATDAAGLPPAARPVRIVVIAELPVLSSGKPDRRAIAAVVTGPPN